MSEDLIRYDVLLQDALRGVVRRVLSEVERTGLPGEHHFFIQFDTNAPGVRISSRLKAEYPEDMTVVIQHQFWDLAVSEHAFEVGLSFSGVPEKLVVPFTAIRGFFDPSVQFGLQIEPQDGSIEQALSSAAAIDENETAAEHANQTIALLDQQDNAQTEDEAEKPAAKSDATDAAPEKDAEPQDNETENGADVVSLDSFRKRT